MQLLAQAAPLFVVLVASNVTTSITFGAPGVSVKPGTRFGLFGMMMPTGCRLTSMVRVVSPRKSPALARVTPIVTVVGTLAAVTGAAGGAVYRIVAGVIGDLVLSVPKSFGTPS